MTLEPDLFALEKCFWSGDGEYYRRHLDDHCLVAFTKMTGRMSREEVARTVQDTHRWRDISLEPKGFVQPTAESALLAYECRATRGSGEKYRAVVGSGYVRRGDGWKMMFHQQTPLEDG